MKADFEPKEVSTEEVRQICRRGECQIPTSPKVPGMTWVETCRSSGCQILDVRKLDSCHMERIEGAKCIPLDELRGKASELNEEAREKAAAARRTVGELEKNVRGLDRERVEGLDRKKIVVTYCSGPQCSASKEAAKILREKGFCAVHYKDGLAGWKEAGHETVRGCVIEMPRDADPITNWREAGYEMVCG